MPQPLRLQASGPLGSLVSPATLPARNFVLHGLARLLGPRGRSTPGGRDVRPAAGMPPKSAPWGGYAI
eukprot:2140006-Alexandrium_andersonii.AAC.1